MFKNLDFTISLLKYIQIFVKEIESHPFCFRYEKLQRFEGKNIQFVLTLQDLKLVSGSNVKKDKLYCLVDPIWDVLDPAPDIRTLFSSYDEMFFGNKMGSVEVKWSKRMTLCAGLCRFEGKGGLCSVTLSEPLLKFRPRKDLVETLLHEMIHAYLFVTQRDKDRDAHGPSFRSHMQRINSEAGTNITVYHSFHDEVENYRTHWWRCDGPCKDRPPYFGYVKRSMNRAPGPKDTWWSQHQAACTGQFVKIKEPEKKLPVKEPISSLYKQSKQSKTADIRNYIQTNKNTTNHLTFPDSEAPILDSISRPSCSYLSTVTNVSNSGKSAHEWPSDEKGFILGPFPNQGVDKTSSPSNVTTNAPITSNVNFVEFVNSTLVNCPGCLHLVNFDQINKHLDDCLSKIQN